MELDELRKALGLADDADEEQVREAILACKERAEARPPAAAKSVLEALRLPLDASEEDVRGKILELKSPDGMVRRAEFEALQAELAERDAQALVDQAIAACKVTPAQREWAQAYARRDAEGFAKFVECAPRLIHGQAVPPPRAVGPAALTEAQLSVCEHLDLDPGKYAEQVEADISQ